MAYVGKAPQTGAYQILDDISSSFTGSTPGPFNLTVNGTAVSPGNEANCIISVSGVIQEPQSDSGGAGNTCGFKLYLFGASNISANNDASYDGLYNIKFNPEFVEYGQTYDLKM